METSILEQVARLVILLIALYGLLFFLGLGSMAYASTVGVDLPVWAPPSRWSFVCFFYIMGPTIAVAVIGSLMALDATVKTFVGLFNLIGSILWPGVRDRFQRIFVILFCYTLLAVWEKSVEVGDGDFLPFLSPLLPTRVLETLSKWGRLTRFTNT